MCGAFSPIVLAMWCVGLCSLKLSWNSGTSSSFPVFYFLSSVSLEHTYYLDLGPFRPGVGKLSVKGQTVDGSGFADHTV